IKRTTNFTGALSRASNSIPPDDRPNAATTSSSRSEEQWGMAIPNPMPVLMVSSRCLSDSRMLSRSADLILPRLTRRSISSTMAGQRSVAFISGMICSAESKLASDMQIPLEYGRASLAGAPKLTSAIWYAGHMPHPSHLSHPLADFVIQSPRKQPAHTEHVDGGPEAAIAQAVFALAETTWPMFHRNFHKAIACALDKRRDKAVHAFKRNQRAHAFAPHRFQRAPRVAHAVFRETAANGVGDPTGQPLHQCVLPRPAITTHQIGAARDLGEKFRNVRGIIL